MRISSPGFRFVVSCFTFMIAALFALAVAAAMSGCASVQQAIQGYGAVAVTGAHAAADTVVQAQKVALCDLPYSAIQRHPEINPAVTSLCGPLSGAAAK